MRSMIRQAGISVLLALGLSASVLALPGDFLDKLAAPERPETDKARDSARRPLETMQALGVQQGWTVVDVSAGGGWFTWVLSAAVGPEGKVLSQFGERALENDNGQAQRDLAARLGNVEPVFAAVSAIPDNSADAAVTALNFHDAYNFRGQEGAQTFLKEIYDVLKPGGVAAIIDHVGEDGLDNANLHRIPIETTRQQIELAGFEIVGEPDVLRNTADDHSLRSNDPSLGRASDQFFFLVRKPD